jgi:hypothetical protein
VRAYLLAVAALLLSRPAQANGRFPAASQLVFDPADDKHAALRTTFGLLRASDATTYRWICEKALGFEGTYDPPIAIARGAVLVALPDGITRSRDGECTFTRVLGGATIVDLATDGARVVAITGVAAGAPMGTRAKILLSTDGGETFGAPLDLPEDFRPLTVDLAGSRIYASGYAPFASFAMVVRSDDGGANWTEATFDSGGAGPYIAAVHPTDRDRLYVRLDGDLSDSLMFSSDGGSSFAKVFAAPELLGVALSPDGARVAAGGPRVGVHTAGVDHVFTKLVDADARCLVWNARGLFACGAESFAIASLTDRATPILKLADVEPLSCAPGTTVGDVCAPFWPEVARAIKPAGAPDAGVDATLGPPAVSATGGGCAYGGPSASVRAAFLLILAALVRRGISSVRPRLPCGRSLPAPSWPSASPSRSSS